MAKSTAKPTEAPEKIQKPAAPDVGRLAKEIFMRNINFSGQRRLEFQAQQAFEAAEAFYAECDRRGKVVE